MKPRSALNLILLISLCFAIVAPAWAGGMDDGNLPDFDVPDNPYSTVPAPLEIAPAETTAPAVRSSRQEPAAKPSKTKSTPARKLKKPLRGGVEQSELKGDVEESGLNGRASDRQELNQAEGALDERQPIEGGTDGNDPMNLGASNDPDEGNQELEIAWDLWRNLLMQTIQVGLIEKLNLERDVHFVRDPGSQRMRSRYPIGTSVRYSLRVLPNRKLVDVKLLQRSPYPTFDRAVIQSIHELQGKKVLQYPKGSKRLAVTQEANLSTAAKSKLQNFQFGDVERQSF